MNDLVRGGFAQAEGPATESGYLAYGVGREFLPELVNYCTYPSFEAGSPLATGWSLLNSTTASQPTPTIVSGRTGGSAQRLVYTSAGDSNKAAYLTSGGTLGPWSGAEACTFSVYCKGSVTGAQANLTLYDQAWNVLANENFSPTSEWARYEASGVGAAGTTAIWVFIGVLGIDTGNAFDLTFDDAMLEKSASASDYIEGTRAASQLVYTDIATIDSSGVTAAGTNVAYARNSGDFYGPVLVTPTAKSAGTQTAIAALWSDPAALLKSDHMAVGDTLIPLDGDSRAFVKLR